MGNLIAGLIALYEHSSHLPNSTAWAVKFNQLVERLIIKSITKNQPDQGPRRDAIMYASCIV